MATPTTSLCIYLRDTLEPNPETMRGLIQEGADPFGAVGVKPNGQQFSVMTEVVANHPDAVDLFRILARFVDMRGRLQNETFYLLPNFLSIVTETDNRELFLVILPYLVGVQVLFQLPVDPWYWNEFFKQNPPEILQDITYNGNNYDVLGYALEKGAPMEILRFIAKNIRINPLEKFDDGYGYLELACCNCTLEVVEWLVNEIGCLCYAYDVHGRPLSAASEIHDDHFDMVRSTNYIVHQMGIHMLQEIEGVASKPFPLLVTLNCENTGTILPKLLFLFQHGALIDLNRRLAFDDLYDVWYGVPNPLKLATVIHVEEVRITATLHLLKNGAVPTRDVLESPRGTFIPQLAQEAVKDYLWLGYFFLEHGADDTKAKRQKTLGPKLPNVLYKTIGSFLLCARSKDYICLSRCLAAMA